MSWITRVALLTTVTAVAAGAGFVLGGGEPQSASAHGRQSGRSGSRRSYS